MKIQENIVLAQHTTFKIGGPARFFCSVVNEDELIQAVAFAREKKLPLFILGGGSNILMSDKGFAGLVIKMEIGGIEIEKGKKQTPLAGSGLSKEGNIPAEDILSAGAGVQWDTLVEYAVEQGLYGLENLSAIPGTVGAAPVQNIGAYGMDVSHTIYMVRAYDTHTNQYIELTPAECHFTYRDSIFKKEKGRYIVTKVYFALTREGKVNVEYKDVKEYFAQKFSPDKKFPEKENGQTGTPTLKEVRAAIIDIRWNKLPDWKLWGTAGSFFKNPIISTEHYEGLKKKYPDLPGYPEAEGLVKVPLGWILDKICNMKGLCVGHVCVYEKQALVLVSKPGGTSEEVVKLAQDIMKTVKDKTGIDIEGEVEWVN